MAMIRRDAGHVFMLESAPWRRVASPAARQQYENTKLRLIDEVDDDRAADTDGETEIFASLLEEA
jgi:hypothetical protein